MTTYNLSRKLFSLGGKSFTCDDFVKALDYYGIWEQWLGTVKDGELCSRFAHEEKYSANVNVLQHWASEFRYEMDLLTVDDFSGWLATVDLKSNDFESYLLRRFWRERFSDNKDISSDRSSHAVDVTPRQVFSEIYFSTSYKNLLFSWQKRLLAWCDDKEGEFPDMSELEDHFKTYTKAVIEQINEEEWLRICFRDLTEITLECIILNDEEETNWLKQNNSSDKIAEFIEKNEPEALLVKEFRRDLPEEVKAVLDLSYADHFTGPVHWQGEDILLKVCESREPTLDNEQVMAVIRDNYLDEIWKTLMVKYVN